MSTYNKVLKKNTWTSDPQMDKVIKDSRELRNDFRDTYSSLYYYESDEKCDSCTVHREDKEHVGKTHSEDHGVNGKIS